MRLAGIGVRIELLGIGIERAHALAGRALAHALGLEQGVDLAGDFRDLVEAQLMDFVRRHIGRGAATRRIGVIGLALGQAPNAGIMDGAGATGGHRVDLPGEGRRYLAGDDLFGPRLPVAVYALVPGAAGNRADQGVLRLQRLQLLDRLVDDEIGRHDAGGGVTLELGGFLVQHRGKGLQAREIGLGIGPGFDAVLAVQEVRHGLVRAAQLAEHIGTGAADRTVVERFRAFKAVVGIPQDGVVIDAVHAAERLAIDGGEALFGVSQMRHLGLAIGRAVAIQFRLLRGEGAGVETQRCARLGR